MSNAIPTAPNKEKKQHPPTKEYLLEKYGADYYKRIGKLGRARHGAEFYKRFSRLGNEAQRRKFGKEFFRERAKKANATLLKRFKTEEEKKAYFKKLAERGYRKVIEKYGVDFYRKQSIKAHQNNRMKKITQLTSIVQAWIADVQTLQEAIERQKVTLVELHTVPGQNLNRLGKKLERHRKRGLIQIEKAKQDILALTHAG